MSALDDRMLIAADKADLTVVARSIRHYLDRIELRTNGSAWNATKTSGYTVAEVPEWALRQWLAVVEGGAA